MEAQPDFSFFQSYDRMEPFDINLNGEEDFSEPQSGVSSSAPSSPEAISFLPDALLSAESVQASPAPSSPVSVDAVMTDEPSSEASAIDFSAYSAENISDDLSDLDDDDTSSAKRSRKRRKTNDEEAVEVAPLSNIPIPDPTGGQMLGRDHLLALSSTTFEEYIKKLQATRDLNAEEKKEVKRQRRLIKNRESAQASRQRKKSYLDKLEQKVAAISNVNAQLREQLTAMQTSNRSLSAENKSLKEQVARLQTALQKTHLPSLIESGTKLVAAANSDPHVGSGVSKIGSSTRAAGVCLLVLLCSFGLLFPQLQRGNNPFSPSTGGEAVGIATRLEKNTNYQLASADQPLPEVLAGQGFNTKRISTQYEQRLKDQEQAATIVAPASPNSSVMEEDSVLYEDSSSSEDDLPPRRYPGEAKRKRTELTSAHENAETFTQMGAIEINGEEMLNATQVPRIDVPAITEWSKNTTYLLCDNIKHMTPALIAAASGQQTTPAPTVDTVETQANESYVAFYIPPDPASTPVKTPSSAKAEPPQFMELKCKIIGVEMVPSIRKMGRLGLATLPLVEASA